MRSWVQLATEQFPPSGLVRQAEGVERAGFDGLNVSDHFQPWWEPGHSGHAWALLFQTGFSWAEDDDAAMEGTRVWKASRRIRSSTRSASARWRSSARRSSACRTPPVRTRTGRPRSTARRSCPPCAGRASSA